MSPSSEYTNASLRIIIEAIEADTRRILSMACSRREGRWLVLVEWMA